jgi:hypothetical protein
MIDGPNIDGVHVRRRCIAANLATWLGGTRPWQDPRRGLLGAQEGPDENVLRADHGLNAWIEVGTERLDIDAIRRLCETADYPLPRADRQLP